MDQAEHARAHYLRNSANVKRRAMAHKRAITRQGREVVAAAKAVPCSDCKRRFPAVCMDFDHVRGEKDFDVSTAGRWTSIAVLEAEIAKCEVVCSNCHRLRTEYRRRDARRLAQGERVKLGLAPCGHPYDGYLLVTRKGISYRSRRVCSSCNRKHQRERVRALRARRAAAIEGVTSISA
jgi:hypothetical protein